MKLIGSLCASLLVASVAAGQGTDSRATSLKLPAARTPAVADAASRGDLAAVRQLLAQHADVNVPQGDGMTALHWAAQRGDANLADLLLRAKANVKATTRIGNYTPLHVASKTGNPAVVKALLKAGADANALTTTGVTALHMAASGGNAEVVTALLDHGANANARDAEWGQTPLVFAAEADRGDAIRALLKHGADPSVHTNVWNITEEAAKEQAATKKRNEVLMSFEPEKHKGDSVLIAAAKAAADSQAAQGGAQAFRAGGGGGGRGPQGPQPKGPFTPAQIQQAIEAGRVVETSAAAGKGPVTEEVDTLNGGIVGFNGTVGGVGGLSPLHHAARQGNVAAVVALIEGGANVNDVGAVDQSTPLLVATINGQFDAALKLIEHGANPNLAASTGIAPLWATINTQWAPKSRYPQPQAVQNQNASYLDVMAALLKAGANPNARLTQQPWYFAYNNCGNANCGLENIEGTTPFWRAAYGLDVDAMKLLVANGADPNLPSMRTPAAPGGGRGGRGGRGGGGRGGGGAAGAPGAAGGAAPDSAQMAAFAARRGGGGGGGGGGGADGAGRGGPIPTIIDSAAKAAPVGIGVFAIHAAAGVGYGNGFAGNAHRHAPNGWMPAMKYLVEELHADVNARDNNGMTPLFHAAARGDNDMIMYLVSKGADPKAVSRNGKTTVDMANSPVSRISPIPSTIALLEKLGAINTHRCASC